MKASLYKIIFFGYFYLSLTKGIACSCCYFTTTFCSVINKERAPKIALIEIQKIEEPFNYTAAIQAKVLDDLFDNIPEEVLLILGSGGERCNEKINYIINDTILIRLYDDTLITLDDQDSIVIESVYQNGSCGIGHLAYSNNYLEGSILPNVNKILYADFKNNISACQSSPKYINTFGRIVTWNNLEKGIQLEGMHFNNLPAAIDSSGYFNFPYGASPKNSGHFLMNPSSNRQLLKGVSTLDILKISKHILNIEPFNTPWQMIAADVNNSGSITILDMIILKKAILGLQDHFSNNNSWRFVHSEYVFQFPETPWKESFDRIRDLDTCNENQYIELVAIKIGDVDGSIGSN